MEYGFFTFVGLTIVAVGFFVGSRMPADRSRWLIGLALGVLPPAAVAALYLLSSNTGCSGGDCIGPMIGMLALGVLALPISAFGVGVLLQAGLSWMVRETGGA